ncbi:MAG: hypothetical protein K5905_10235 [Roseibium sp.]|uniref:hypothetical protein n=1 Tax=Roseibium sp. TaxID=1936156 RepID=UPI0026106FDF|nr:hypothetical protein [Roseibium sp.]MCV0425842.1 hypothetical protein [Roseibium sp.]
MTEDLRKKGLKSVGGSNAMRSRGFLSQPGGQLSSRPGKESLPNGDAGHHKSRGARQISVSTDGKPQNLTVKPKIKPYTLEDE